MKEYRDDDGSGMEDWLNFPEWKGREVKYGVRRRLLERFLEYS